jgi:hypothetical protein
MNSEQSCFPHGPGKVLLGCVLFVAWQCGCAANVLNEMHDSYWNRQLSTLE